MIVKPYEKYYLEDVKDTVGGMLEYAVGCGFNPIVVWEMFVSSKVAMEIEKANPKYLAGYSSIDYLSIVINTMPVKDYKRTEETLLGDQPNAIDNMYYWAGSSITELQYETGLTFYNINKYFPIRDVLALYSTLHEADISKFIDIAQTRIKKEKPDTNLKIIRKAAGLTQQELATKSHVELRSIQMYEQRRNDINKAQVDTLYKLSKILGCKIEDLMEI